MVEKLEKELLGIGGGLALVELGPDAAIAVLEEFKKAAGAEFNNTEISGLEQGIEVTQDVAVVVALAMLIYAGLKHMVKGGQEKFKMKQAK